MISQSIFLYFWFGTCVRYLQDLSEGALLGTESGPGAVGNLHHLFEYIDSHNLQVTKRASGNLWAFYNDLLQQEPEDALTADQAGALRDFVRELRVTLEAELRGFEAYIVTPKRLNVDDLLGNVERLLSPNVYPRLPDIAQYDFAEAGKCTAFERPTAAAFHLLRATESVLRLFYREIVRRNRTDSLLWGRIVDDLRAKARSQRTRAASYSTLIAHLDHIRHSFRNPTQHPDMRYSIHEVMDLWGVCIDAVNRMAAALPE